MKSRWITVIGRTGSVLLVVGLALGLLYLLPPGPTGYNAQASTNMMPGKYYILPYTRVYSPKIFPRIPVSYDNSVQLYLLNTHFFELRAWTTLWVMEHIPDLDPSQIWLYSVNVSVLHEFLQAHPGALLLNDTVSGQHTLVYSPLKMTNVTLVISNPSQVWVDGEIKLTEWTILVAKEHVVIPGALIILGGILSLPWSVEKIRGLSKNG